jgi:hypothetical protein
MITLSVLMVLCFIISTIRVNRRMKVNKVNFTDSVYDNLFDYLGTFACGIITAVILAINIILYLP